MDLNFQDPQPEVGNAGIEPVSTAGEAFRASYALSEMDSTTHSVMDIAEIQSAKNKGGPELTPEELNAKYPGLEKPFTAPMSDNVAGIIANRSRERKSLADTIAKGPEGGFYGISNFGAALLPHAIDPINVGSGLLLSGGIGYLARGAEAGVIASRVYGAARAARIAAAVHKGGIIGTFAEGVAGNLITEPLTLIAAQQDDRDYTTTDFMMNTVGGAALIPALVHGGKFALKGVKWGGDMAISKGAAFAGRVDPELGAIINKSSIARMLSDKKMHPELYITDAVKAIDGAKPKWSNVDYEFSKIDVSQPAGNRRLFVTTYDKGMDLKAGAFTDAPTEHVGYGIYAVDRPEVANGAASRRTGGTGEVVEIKLNDDFKMIDADQIHNDIKIDANDINVEGKTLKEILDEARDLDIEDGGQRLDKINQAVIDKGYDGVTFSRDSAQEVPLSTPHNEVLVLNHDKVTEIGRTEPDVLAKGRLDSAEIQKVYNENTQETGHFLMDEAGIKIHEDFENKIQVPDKTPKITELNKLSDAKAEEIKSLKDQGLLDADDLRQLEALDEAAKGHEDILTAQKMAADCLGVI